MKNSVVLVIVVGTLFVVQGLGWIALYLMRQQSRLVELKVRRIRAFYAAWAGIVHTQEKLRQEGVYDSTLTIGAGIKGYPPGGLVVNITKIDGAGPGNTAIINATVKY